jgi:alanine dehydrogenase
LSRLLRNPPFAIQKAVFKRKTLVIIGVGKEIKEDETRVGLTPHGVQELKKRGHAVLVERDAGQAAFIDDADFAHAGAEVVDKPVLYEQAEFIIKVKTPLPDEVDLFRPGQILMTYLHLDENIPPSYSLKLAATRVTGIAYEWIQENGQPVLLTPMSELTGAIFACRALDILMDKKGVLGGKYLDGTERRKVLLIGAGTIGMVALRVFLDNGLDVFVFDKRPASFKERAAQYIPRSRLDDSEGYLHVLESSEENWQSTQAEISSILPETDILFCAAVRRPSLPVEKCRHLITREMLQAMPDNGIVIDATACDKDLIETAVSSPRLRYMYQDEGLWHYCCDHIPALIPVTSTQLLTRATLPYIVDLAGKGMSAIVQNQALRAGVMCTGGHLTHRYTCDKKGLPYTPLDQSLR